jgi:hypothetical protein
MGLLDEAIREHLELKRRRGADPNAVARAEQEALAPVFPDEPDDGVEYEPDVALELEQIELASPAVAPPSSSEDARLASFSALDQATAELDMLAFLDEDGDEAEDSAAPGAIDAAEIPGVDAAQTPGSEPDWGFPNEAQGESTAEDSLGQERLSFE